MHLNGSKCISQRKFSSHGQCSYLFLIGLVSDKGKKETLQMFKAGKSSTTLSITSEDLIWQDFFTFFLNGDPLE